MNKRCQTNGQTIINLPSEDPRSISSKPIGINSNGGVPDLKKGV